jgi:hypothetical protein
VQFFWLPSLSANPSVRRHLGKSWFQYMARHQWKATMASTALRGQTPQGHQRHRGTNATGAQGHRLLPWEHKVARAPTPRGHRATGYCREGLKTWFFNQATCTSWRTLLHRYTWGSPDLHFFCPARLRHEATLRESQTASTASDGHTYNPVLTSIHRAPIADSALQFWSGNFPALMRTRHRTPMSIQQHGLVTAWRRRSATWM